MNNLIDNKEKLEKETEAEEACGGCKKFGDYETCVCWIGA